MDKEALFHLALTQSLLRKVLFNCTKTVNIFTFFAYRGGQVSAGLLYSQKCHKYVARCQFDRLVTSCNYVNFVMLQQFCKLVTTSLWKQLAANLWIRSFDNQLAISLLTTWQQTCCPQADASRKSCECILFWSGTMLHNFSCIAITWETRACIPTPWIFPSQNLCMHWFNLIMFTCMFPFSFLDNKSSS